METLTDEQMVEIEGGDWVGCLTGAGGRDAPHVSLASKRQRDPPDETDYNFRFIHPKTLWISFESTVYENP